MDIPRFRGETRRMYAYRCDFISARLDWYSLDELIPYSFVHLNKVLFGMVYDSNVELWYRQMLEESE
jgi:hypothetical protein